MASCSRDSTVRLWSLTPLITPLLLNIITDQPWEKITGNTGETGSVRFFPPPPRHLISSCWLCLPADTAMVPGSSPLLCGKVSRDIRQELDKLSCDIRTKKLRWFSECFSVTNSVSSLSLSLMGLCLRLVESYSISDEKWESFKTCKRLFFSRPSHRGAAAICGTWCQSSTARTTRCCQPATTRA